MTVSGVEAGLLCGSSLCVAEHPHHKIASFALVLEVPGARFPWRQQEHHPVAQEAKSSALLLCKIVDVLLELTFLCIVLRNEGYHALSLVSLYILEIRSVTHVQIVILIGQKGHYTIVFQIADDVGLHQDPVGFISRHEP